MIGGNALPRRADEFDAALRGRASGATREQYAELLDVVAAMRAVPTPVARPEFVADLRSQLVAAAEAMPARRTDEATALRLTPTQRRGGRERRLAALIGGFAVVAASGSMAVASQSALPGDVLYPVKRAIENAHANLQTSPEAKASVLFDNAQTRLSEVEDLTAHHSGDADQISSTLQDFKDQTSQATTLALREFTANRDDGALDEVRSFAGSTIDRLAALDDVLPAEARPALIAAAQTVRSADSAAYAACPTCSPGEIVQLPEFALNASADVKKTIDTVTGTSQPTRHGQSPTTTAGSAGGSASSEPSGTQPSPGPAATLPDTEITVPPVVTPTSPSEEQGGIVSGTIKQVTKGLLGDADSGTSGDTGDGQSSPSQPDSSTSPSVVKNLTDLLGLG